MNYWKSCQYLLIIVLAATTFAAPVRAEQATYGYLWSLNFDFEQSYNGQLTIDVGPWQDGDLVSVDATSTSTVYCRPVGRVSLDNGDAVFAGGYLQCNMDLAWLVQQNHGLTINPRDSYGSIVMHTNLMSSAQNVATILHHPDASYRIDFTQTSSVGMEQSLNNQAGVQSHGFAGIVPTTRQNYSFLYGCVWGGNCQGALAVATSGQPTPVGGDRISWGTTATSFQIGGGRGETFRGRIGNLWLDPGNSVH
jgi:hypothetical protein